MFVDLDETTSINTDMPILYVQEGLADSEDGQKVIYTRIAFAVEGIDPLYVASTREEVLVALGMPRVLLQDFTGLQPAEALAQEQLPLEGELPVDYLNRISEAAGQPDYR